MTGICNAVPWLSSFHALFDSQNKFPTQAGSATLSAAIWATYDNRRYRYGLRCSVTKCYL